MEPNPKGDGKIIDGKIIRKESSTLFSMRGNAARQPCLQTESLKCESPG
jgi:hypothetical protein